MEQRCQDDDRRCESGSRTASAIGAVVYCLSLFIFIFGTKPFHLGLWYQSEPVVLAFYLSGAGAALSLLLLTTTGHPVWRALSHPVVVLPLVLAVWSALVSPLTPLPWRSWFGAPETAEGVLWYLVLALQTALALTLWRYRRFRLILVVAAVTAGLTITGLNVAFPEGSPWRPGKWPDYAAFVGLFTSMIIFALPVPSRHRFRIASVAIIVGGFIIFCSENWTGILLVSTAGPALFLTIWILERRRWMGRWLRLLLSMGAVLTPLVIFGGITVVSNHKTMPSTVSRLLLSQVALMALASEPMALVHGTGWGAFNDTLFKYAFRIEGTSLFEDDKYQPNWEALGGGAFHAHNSFLEAVLSTGLVGGGLFLIIPAVSILMAQRRNLLVAASGWLLTAGLMAAWFMLPMCVPFQALALAATAGGTGRRVRPCWRRVVPIIMGLAVAMLLLAAAMLWQAAVKGRNLIQQVQSRFSPDSRELDGTPEYGGRGGPHLWWVEVNFSKHLIERVESGQAITPDQARWYGALLDAIDQYGAEGRASIRLQSRSIVMRNELAAALADSEFDSLRDQKIKSWENTIDNFVLKVPNRTDMAVPYFSLLMQTNNEAVALKFSERILERNAHDPVALWYSGLVLLEDPKREAVGIQRVIKAIDLGIGRFFPVNAKLMALIAAERR